MYHGCTLSRTSFIISVYIIYLESQVQGAEKWADQEKTNVTYHIMDPPTLY